jgi:hypothetical protein
MPGRSVSSGSDDETPLAGVRRQMIWDTFAFWSGSSGSLGGDHFMRLPADAASPGLSRFSAPAGVARRRRGRPNGDPLAYPSTAGRPRMPR